MDMQSWFSDQLGWYRRVIGPLQGQIAAVLFILKTVRKRAFTICFLTELINSKKKMVPEDNERRRRGCGGGENVLCL